MNSVPEEWNVKGNGSDCTQSTIITFVFQHLIYGNQWYKNRER